MKAELSPSEIKVIRYICRGLENKKIAVKLHQSTRAVENIRFRIHQKLRIKKLALLVVYAIKKGIYKIK